MSGHDRSRGGWGTRTLIARLRPLICALAGLAPLATAPPALAGGAPAGLPGPPPGFGTSLPLPPPPGQAPPPEGGLPATTVGGSPSGPGLLSGYAAVRGRKLPVRIACSRGGRARLRAGSVTAAARYRCARGRSTISFGLPRTQAAAISHAASLTGALTIQQGATVLHLSLSLGRTAPAPNFWVSAYGLSCPGAAGSGPADLLAPNFSAATPTTIDVRPWLAWYTAATGWQWLGTQGPDRSGWYRWTATPGGVAEWRRPTGITPWTWGPISVAPGHATYLISVIEAIYWYSHPNDVWADVHSEPSPTSTTTYCAYP